MKTNYRVPQAPYFVAPYETIYDGLYQYSKNALIANFLTQ